MSSIDCVIVNFKQKINCINLFKILQEESSVNKFFCIDNSNCFSSIELQSKYDKLTIIKLKSNIGFGKANNLGVSLSEASRILICNSDIYFKKGVLDKINILYENKNKNDLGYCFRMLDSDGQVQKSHRRLLDRTTFLINQIGFSWLLGKKNKLVYDKLEHLQEVDQPIGAFLVLDKNHFQSVGGFDSDFFVYYEDVFLFDNLNLRYAKMKYYDSISISHIGGESLKNSFATKLRLQIEGRKIYFLKKKWKKMSNLYLNIEFIIKIFYHIKYLKFSDLFSIYKSYIN